MQSKKNGNLIVSMCQAIGFRLNKWTYIIGAKELIILVLVFIGIYLISFLVHLFDSWNTENKWFSFCNCFSVGFSDLFSPHCIAKNICSKIFCRICYFVVWLIGGGVLVSVIIGQIARNANGEFRLWRWLLKEHVVILGWDPKIISKMIKEKDSASRFIIATMKDVREIEKSVVAAGIDAKCFFIYKCLYDDDREINKMNIKSAKAIYVVGEEGETSHDSRVLFLTENITENIKNNLYSPAIEVNINDFGLAHRMVTKKVKDNSPVEGYFNFHLDSAVYMWTLWSKKSEQSLVRNLFVFGFGAMGKAVVVKCPKKYFKNIFITDDDSNKLDEEYKRFSSQISGFDEKDRDQSQISEFDEKDRDKSQISGYSVQKEAYEAVLGKITNELGNNDVIVIAKRRSEKGVLCLMDVLSKLPSKINKDKCSNMIFLSQEIKTDVWNGNERVHQEMLFNDFTVNVFGLNNGV